ncbi:hypothetical protein K402DRAFT_34007 [Aulographum hederae CBS 113979]|uniref:Uncharacterized protein n=1 Tax=Aulographum hederae CBS 113979 TaxID=1176131 RepID=A0A6G1H5D1_9PEZI|nr:hypothetical protein K402DRAFT_34007 [Aulographum hederae CBS 113979]
MTRTSWPNEARTISQRQKRMYGRKQKHFSCNISSLHTTIDPQGTPRPRRKSHQHLMSGKSPRQPITQPRFVINDPLLSPSSRPFVVPDMSTCPRPTQAPTLRPTPRDAEDDVDNGGVCDDDDDDGDGDGDDELGQKGILWGISVSIGFVEVEEGREEERKGGEKRS